MRGAQAASIVLMAATAASCGPFDPLPDLTAIVTNESDRTYLVRFVPDQDGPTYVYEVPAGARGDALAAPQTEGWQGTLEVLDADCTVIGSIDIDLLIGDAGETIIGEDGQPRDTTVSGDDQRAADTSLTQVPGVCD